MNTSELLTNYRKTGSEAAFTSLLRQYTNLVYSVAKRRLSDQSLAEEVTQTVFMRLAKSPPNLKHDGELASWLHRTTIHVAIDVWRSETRRRTREQQVAAMQTLTADDSQLWKDMTPHLDEALNQLADEDRQAVLLRFFDRKPMRDIGGILGVSEDAAKMRVSRALDRLRHQLAQRGITCTVVVLATLLAQCAVEAAPGQLLTRLMAMKLAAPLGAGGILAGITQAIKSKAAMGAVAALVVIVAALVLVRHEKPKANETNLGTTQTDPLPQFDNDEREALSSVNAGRSANSTPEVRTNTRFMLRVVDIATGTGLPDAKIRAAYFYAGGVGEGHSMQTDSDGFTPVPDPNHPERSVGLNLFVSVEGYVPQAANLHGTEARSNYVFELESALTVGGIVVDEFGLPVAGVQLEAQRAHSDPHKQGEPNTDFQTCKIKTDDNGLWAFPYVPKAYATVDFYLSCSNYAVTRISVPVGEFGSLAATLVIERGFTVVGRVTDTEGQPIARATVKERHQYGFRKLATQTDENGYYAMHGLGTPTPKVVDFSNPLKPKATATKPEQEIDLVVQLRGMSSQLHTVRLQAPTNTVNFVLAPGNIFRGRVLNESGDPISGAVVRTDSHFDPYIPTRFEWLTHTDDSGRFEWDSAPTEETYFWFEADGYEIIRGRPMPIDGTDHQVKLTRKGDSTTTKR